MDYILGVGELQTPAYLRSQVDGPLQGQTMVLGLLQQRLNIAAGHERQDHVGLARLIAEVEDLDDVRMVPKSSHGLGLAGYAYTGGRIQSLSLDDSEGNVAIEHGVVGLVDALLASLAKEVFDLVPAVGEGGGLG